MSLAVVYLGYQVALVGACLGILAYGFVRSRA
jgi:hypothetical protein